MSKKLIIVVILVFAFTSLSIGETIILQEDFETGIDGQSFPDWDWPSEQVITNNGIDGKSLMIYRENPSLGNWGIVSPDFTPMYGLIEFDLMMDAPFRLHTATDLEHGGYIPEGIGFQPDGNIEIGTPASEIPTTATWTRGEAFRLSILSMPTEVTFYINGVEIAHGLRDPEYSNLPIESFYFRYGADYIVEAGTMMIDNVIVKIPEPATMCLLAAGIIYLRKRK